MQLRACANLRRCAFLSRGAEFSKERGHHRWGGGHHRGINRRQSTGNSVTGTLGRPKCQHASADEDLFARAAVLNSPPQTLVLKTCETGFELQSGIENDDSTKHL